MVKIFQMVEHYRKRFNELDLEKFDKNFDIDENSKQILIEINNYTCNNPTLGLVIFIF